MRVETREEAGEREEGKDFAIAGEINPGEKTYNVSLRKSSSIWRVRRPDVSERTVQYRRPSAFVAGN